MPKLSPEQYLEEYNFYAFRNFSKYEKKLQQSIKTALNTPDQNTLFPTPKISPHRQDHLAIELGGTYLKIIEFKSKKRRLKILRQYKINFYQQIVYTPEILFFELKQHLDAFIPKEKRANIKFISFAFAFPLKPIWRKKQLLDGQISFLGKNLQHQDLLGLPLGSTFEEYLQANGYKNAKVSLINDSSSALLSTLFYSKKTQNLYLNLIVGTGLNLSVGQINKNKFRLTNLEAGNFDFLPNTIFDDLVDQTSSTHGNSLTEKMVSGAWQSQLFKVILIDLNRRKIIDKKTMMELAFRSSAELEKILPKYRHKFVRKIWQEISKRAAFIAAKIISETIKLSGKKSAFLVETGGVIIGSKIFRKTLEFNLRKSLPGFPLNKILINDTTAAGSLILESFHH